ncbi:hypothetical protein ACR6C2_16690 [Streptomyces sp. INA 01156]
MSSGPGCWSSRTCGQAGGPHGTATIRFRCIADECVRDEDGDFSPDP